MTYFLGEENTEFINYITKGGRHRTMNHSEMDPTFNNYSPIYIYIYLVRRAKRDEGFYQQFYPSNVWVLMVFGDYQPHGLAFYDDARHLLACAAY